MDDHYHHHEQLNNSELRSICRAESQIHDDTGKLIESEHLYQGEQVQMWIVSQESKRYARHQVDPKEETEISTCYRSRISHLMPRLANKCPPKTNDNINCEYKFDC